MTTVVVLGGCGGVGSVAVRTLRAVGDLDVIVADAAAGADRVFDAADPASVAAAIEGADVVLNCVGPFYRFGPPLLAAAIRAGVHYVDICDDLDATVAQLELDEAARASGVTALIGMGNSPGLANVLVRFAADELLETVREVDIMHIHGGEPDEGGAVVRHRIHAMTNDVPLFVDGALRQVRMLEPSGQAFVVETDFRDVGRFPVYPYPHPETITLPRHLPGLRRATNLGVVFPLTYFQRTMDGVAAGLSVDEVVDDVLAARPALLAEAGVTGPAGCLKVVVSGDGPGGTHTYEFSISSTAEGAGEGTGIPAALGAVEVATGRLRQPGVHPPEAIVRPMELLARAGEVLPKLDIAGSGASAVPIHILHRLPDGKTEELDLGL